MDFQLFTFKVMGSNRHELVITMVRDEYIIEIVVMSTCLV
jgi:hypothetical protein